MPGGSTANALPPPSPGGGPAEEEAGGLPPELARPPPGDCDPKVKVSSLSIADIRDLLCSSTVSKQGGIIHLRIVGSGNMQMANHVQQ